MKEKYIYHKIFFLVSNGDLPVLISFNKNCFQINIFVVFIKLVSNVLPKILVKSDMFNNTSMRCPHYKIRMTEFGYCHLSLALSIVLMFSIQCY